MKIYLFFLENALLNILVYFFWKLKKNWAHRKVYKKNVVRKVGICENEYCEISRHFFPNATVRSILVRFSFTLLHQNDRKSLIEKNTWHVLVILSHFSGSLDSASPLPNEHILCICCNLTVLLDIDNWLKINMRGQHWHFKIFIQKPLGCSNKIVIKLCKYLRYFACDNSLVLETHFETPCTLHR